MICARDGYADSIYRGEEIVRTAEDKSPEIALGLSAMASGPLAMRAEIEYGL